MTFSVYRYHTIYRDKYTITDTRMGYKVHMVLTIHKIQERDIGTYKCIATNSLGKSEGSIRLYGKYF